MQNVDMIWKKCILRIIEGTVAKHKFYTFLQAVLGPKMTFPGRFEISQTLVPHWTTWPLIWSDCEPCAGLGNTFVRLSRQAVTWGREGDWGTAEMQALQTERPVTSQRTGLRLAKSTSFMIGEGSLAESSWIENHFAERFRPFSWWIDNWPLSRLALAWRIGLFSVSTMLGFPLCLIFHIDTLDAHFIILIKVFICLFSPQYPFLLLFRPGLYPWLKNPQHFLVLQVHCSRFRAHD